MRLIKCYINNYGKLSDFSYDFSRGINVIEQDNGWGKTTFASFIKAMLFGLEYKTGKTVTERKRYMPWNGNRFGGNLEFEVGGKQYRVERYFGAKDKDDTFVLYDLATNTQSEDFSENLGVEILDVDRDSYEKTAFVNLENNELLNEIIQKKLGGIDEKNVDLELFGRAEEVLNKLANDIKGKRKNTGKIGVLEAEQAELKSLMNEAANAQKSIEEINGWIADLNSRVEECRGKVKKVDEELSKFSAFERSEAYKQIVSRVASTKKEMDEIAASFDKQMPTAKEVEVLESQVNEWKRLRDNQLETKARLDGLAQKHQDKANELDKVSGYLPRVQKIVDEIKATEEQLQQLNGEAESRRKRNNGMLIVLAIIAVLGTVGLAFVSATFAIAFGVLCLVGWVCVFLSGKKNSVQKDANALSSKCDRLQQEKQDLTEQVCSVVESMGFGSSDLMTAISEIKAEFSEYTRLSDEYIARKNQCDQAEAKIRDCFERFFDNIPTDYLNKVTEIRNYLLRFDVLKKNYDNDLNQKNEFEAKYGAENLECVEKPQGMENELKAERDRYQEEVIRLREQIVGYEKKVENLSLTADGVEDIESSIEHNAEEISEYEKKHKLIETTIKALNSARDTLSAKYMKGVSDAFIKFYSAIDAAKEDKYSIDIGLNVLLEEGGSYHDSDVLSSGKKDLVQLCMRFALIEAVYGEEKPVLILDDPFINLDNKKVKSGTQLLAKLAEQYQILYYVCHDARII